MNYRMAILGGLLTGAALLGCRQTVNEVDVSGRDGQTGAAAYGWIVTDATLTETCAVVSARKTRADDLLKVQVEVHNNKRKPKKFFYRFDWLEADGMLVQSPTPIWQTKTIEGSETLMLQAVAPNPRVVDCRLKVQEDVH